MIAATVIGNLGADAEVRDAAGTPVLSFRMASSDGAKDKDKSTWVSVSLFGARATKLVTYLTKGTQVAVSGRLTTRDYEKNGVQRQSVELKADELQFCGSKKDGGQAQAGTQADTGNSSGGGGGGGEDDIPFSFIGDAAERSPKWERF